MPCFCLLLGLLLPLQVKQLREPPSSWIMADAQPSTQPSCPELDAVDTKAPLLSCCLLQDKLLRELDASLIVADAQTTLWLMGNGDVLEAGADGVIGIGSGADFAESAARALLQLHNEAQQQQQEPGSASESTAAAAAAGVASPLSAEAAQAIAGMSLFDVAKKAMSIAADCCVYTNANISWHHIQTDGSIVSGDSASAAAAAPAAAAASDSVSPSSWCSVS
jgi:ATP-dependent protease HslVU (ClpYQ) peptidase subunit